MFKKIIERYLHMDLDYLLKGGFWLFLSQGFSLLFSALAAIAFANFLPKETYGQYRYLLAIFGYLTLFSMRNVGRATIQATARGYEGSLMPGFKMRVRWSFLGSAAAVFFAGYYFLRGNFVLGISFLMIALFMPLIAPSDSYHAHLRGKQLFKFLSKSSIIIQFLFTIAIILTLLLTDNIIFLVLTYFFSQTVLNYFFFYLTIKKFPPNKKQDPKTLSYGKHLSFIEALDIISLNFDLVLLWYLLGAEIVAVYSFAWAVPQKVMGVFSGPMYPLAFPKMSRRTPEELKRNMPRKAFFLFLFLLPITLLYIIFAPLIFKVFFPTYLEAVFYSQICSLTILFLPEALFSYSLMAQMKTKLIYINKLIYPLFRIILLVILTLLYGIMGAILALLIAQFCKLILSMILFKKI